MGWAINEPLQQVFTIYFLAQRIRQ
jgi:hypothetical protein